MSKGEFFYDHREVLDNYGVEDSVSFTFERSNDNRVREMFKIPGHILETKEVKITGFQRDDILRMPYYLEKIEDVSQKTGFLQTRVYLMGYPNPVIIQGEHYLTSYNFAFEHAGEVEELAVPGSYYVIRQIAYKILYCDYFDGDSRSTCGSESHYYQNYIFKPVPHIENVFYFFNPEVHIMDFANLATSAKNISLERFEEGKMLYIRYHFGESEDTSIVVRSRSWDGKDELMPVYLLGDTWV